MCYIYVHGYSCFKNRKVHYKQNKHATKYSKAHSILYEVTQKYISSDIYT